MKHLSTIHEILTDQPIFVPSYQRAYAWETPSSDFYGKTHTDVFLSDLREHITSGASSPYYFGHFIFEKTGNGLAIIDGQQRLTTIAVFLSVLHACLATRKIDITILHDKIFSYQFTTVEYDKIFFNDYIRTDQQKKNINFHTVSAKRLYKCAQYFIKEIQNFTDEYAQKIFNTICSSFCTTHIISEVSEAVQMFIFQNNRGKNPSNIEIVKAQFMHCVYLHLHIAKEDIINEINDRFANIYRYIGILDDYIQEDNVLLHSLRIYCNSLWVDDTLALIADELKKDGAVNFVNEFTAALEKNFGILVQFYTRDNTIDNLPIHSLISLNKLTIALPFILKAYKFDLPKKNIYALCAALESLALRHALIGTRAEIPSRLDDVFKAFTASDTSIQPVLERIAYLKTAKGEDWWWAYWNNSALKRSLQGKISPETARFLLWRYEIFLCRDENMGYLPPAFDSISEHLDLEHVAPRIPPRGETVASGYAEYDRDFKEQYIDCLGNYLLISGKHNKVIGNRPFKEKKKTYTFLLQQKEVANMVQGRCIWNKARISKRKKKIIKFIMDNF